MDKLEFWTLCSANGIVLEKEQVEQCERYERELRIWNEKVNLISRKDEEHIWDHHILHSMSLLSAVKIKEKARCLDVGTGGGFPGIPVKIARPDLYMVLADSIAKKMKLTEMFAKHTGLRGFETLNIRVEELTRKASFHASFDVIMARAVAPVVELVGWTRTLLKPGGLYVFLKGGDLSEEIAAAKAAYGGLQVELRDLRMHGTDWFQEQEKKIVVASFSSQVLKQALL